MEQRGPPDDSLAASAMAAITRLDPDSRGKLSLAKIRHGLRTPINHIIGYAEILQEEAVDKLPTVFVADLEKIHSGGNMLLALVNLLFREDGFGAAYPSFHALWHKIRTPVNTIIGYGELLAEQCDDAGQPEIKSDLAKIVSAAHAWLAMVEEHLGEQQTLFSATPITSPSSRETSSTLPQYWSSLLFEDERSGLSGYEHLLLADDDEANRDLLRRRLEKLGYRITECADGREALRLAREAAPDLVLLDMLMPFLDGYEVLARIKSDEALRHLPVIMISALDQMEPAANCIQRLPGQAVQLDLAPSARRRRSGEEAVARYRSRSICGGSRRSELDPTVYC